MISHHYRQSKGSEITTPTATHFYKRQWQKNSVSKNYTTLCLDIWVTSRRILVIFGLQNQEGIMH